VYSDSDPLVLQIVGSFGGMSYPGDDHIVYDNSDAHVECFHVKRALVGRNWCDVPLEVLAGLRSALAFLSPEGYRFYMPAFMVLSIVDYDGADVISGEIVQSLTPPRDTDVDALRALAQEHPERLPVATDDWQRWVNTCEHAFRSGAAERAFFERTGPFSSGQRQAVRQFLEHVRDVHGADFPGGEPQIALQRHWAAF
jgi:hypothetical protein